MWFPFRENIYGKTWGEFKRIFLNDVNHSTQRTRDPSYLFVDFVDCETNNNGGFLSKINFTF